MFFHFSIKYIYQEIKNEYGYSEGFLHGDLTSWATQGVLLLNTVLTVREGEANSHAGKGWEQFTDTVISGLNENDYVVWMLWGNHAKKKKKLITNPTHLILESGHPSPLSANRGHWFENNHFKNCNGFLKQHDRDPINWKII